MNGIAMVAVSTLWLEGLLANCFILLKKSWVSNHTHSFPIAPQFSFTTPHVKGAMSKGMLMSLCFQSHRGHMTTQCCGDTRTRGRCVRDCRASCGPRVLPVGEETSVPLPWHKLYIQSQVSVSGQSPLPVPSYWARLGLHFPETSKTRLVGCLE